MLLSRQSKRSERLNVRIGAQLDAKVESNSNHLQLFQEEISSRYLWIGRPIGIQMRSQLPATDNCSTRRSRQGSAGSLHGQQFHRHCCSLLLCRSQIRLDALEERSRTPLWARKWRRSGLSRALLRPAASDAQSLGSDPVRITRASVTIPYRRSGPFSKRCVVAHVQGDSPRCKITTLATIQIAIVIAVPTTVAI